MLPPPLRFYVMIGTVSLQFFNLIVTFTKKRFYG